MEQDLELAARRKPTQIQRVPGGALGASKQNVESTCHYTLNKRGQFRGTSRTGFEMGQSRFHCREQSWALATSTLTGVAVTLAYGPAASEEFKAAARAPRL